MLETHRIPRRGRGIPTLHGEAQPAFQARRSKAANGAQLRPAAYGASRAHASLPPFALPAEAISQRCRLSQLISW